jgi:hypothetical protein
MNTTRDRDVFVVSSGVMDRGVCAAISIEINREYNLSLDRPARNLIAHAGPLLAVKPSLSRPMFAGMSRQSYLFGMVSYPWHVQIFVQFAVL